VTLQYLLWRRWQLKLSVGRAQLQRCNKTLESWVLPIHRSSIYPYIALSCASANRLAVSAAPTEVAYQGCGKFPCYWSCDLLCNIWENNCPWKLISTSLSWIIIVLALCIVFDNAQNAWYRYIHLYNAVSSVGSFLRSKSAGGWSSLLDSN
jgi:hypothetical protein